jgi:S1-C subfamily serine protease
MIRFFFVLTMALFAKQLYLSGTNHQEDVIAITPFIHTVNLTPMYSGAIRIYHDNIMCSGAVINDKYAVTAAHCGVSYARIMTTESIVVRDFFDRYTGTVAKFVALDHNRDIAIIKGDFKSFQTFPINIAYSPKYGDILTACGFPNDSSYTCNQETFDSNFYEQYFVTGPALIHGMSGGAVFNTDKEVVAVNSAISYKGSILSPIVGLIGLFGM